MKTDDTYRVYFTLCEDCDNECDETLGMKEAWELLKEFSDSARLQNEGHNESGLLCYFTITCSRVNALYEFIKKNHGGGDDILYLPSGMSIREFFIVKKPGTSPPIPFEEWEDWNERKTDE